MSKQYFSIQQLSFNIGFYSKEKGHELQNKVSRLYHQQLHSLLKNFFYKTVPENVLIRKDSLLLDLGSLSYDELERELPKRLEKALEEQFLPFLLKEENGSQDNKGFERVPAEAGYEYLLEFFLVTGALPWQASMQSHLTWQAFLQALYQQDRNTLSSLLYKLGRRQPVRIRLAFQSNAEDMQKIITAIEPVEAPFILSYKNKIGTIQQEKQLVRSDASGFSQAVSYFILTYLLEEKESLFSKKAFIKSVLHQMAAHYNISFTALLQVLYEALPLEKREEHASNSLFALVQALFKESLISNTTTPGSLPLPSASDPLAVLEFFLVTGQLPQQAGAKRTFTWQAVLHELYEHNRDHLNILLRRLGRRYDIRKRLAYQLTEDDLQKVFEVIEPVEVVSILAYKKNIVAVQQEKQLVIAAATDFIRAVSFFILTYLLEEKESIFSKKMFIKSVLRQMADHYNTFYPDLLVVLYEAVPAVEITRSQQASFFQMIQEIYREDQPARVMAPYTFTTNKAGAHPEKGAAAFSTSIPDILYYFLQYGAMPFRAKEQSDQSPESLLQQLYAHSVEDTLRLLKRAGMQERSKQRFLWQFSESLLYKVFSHLPGWNKVAAIFELTIQLIETVPAFGRIAQQVLKYALLDAVWSSYIEQGYNAFNEDYFYTLTLEQLSAITKIRKDEIIYHFREAISREKNDPANAGSYQALMRLEQAVNLFSSGNTVITVAPARIIAGSIQYGNLDLLVRQYAGTTIAQPGENRMQQVINILEYYLTWNRFPDSLHTGNRQELDNHLSAMLLLLYHENREALKRILDSNKHAAAARMHLHHMFAASKGGDYKQVSLLLDEYEEKDTLQYIKEMTGDSSIHTEGGLKKALDYLLEKAKSGLGERITLILQSASLTSYIARHYDDKTIQWLIENRPGSDKNVSLQAAAIRNLLTGCITDAGEKNRLRLLLNEATLLHISGTHQLKDIKAYVSALFRFLSHSASVELLRVLPGMVKAGIDWSAADKELIQLIQRELEQHLQQRERGEALKKKLEAAERKKQEETTRALQQQLQQKLQKQKEQEEQATGKKPTPLLHKTEKLYITNAGLVLLHPFLSTYFTRLNLMEKGQFINREAQARAVHLLQYLAYNTTEHPEHELVLNKILCNYPLHEALPLEITLDPHEADLSAELLQVVIQRSGKLSNSTVDGFRVSFLHREGVLTETEEAWTLRVEQRGYDMMLQMLPWAFGMIKFSWMDKPVYVEWV